MAVETTQIPAHGCGSWAAAGLPAGGAGWDPTPQPKPLVFLRSALQAASALFLSSCSSAYFAWLPNRNCSSTLPPPKCVSVQAAGPKLLEIKSVEGLSGGKSVLEGVQGQLQCFVLRWVYLLTYQSRIE